MKTPKDVAAGMPPFEAALCDPDHWHEIDAMAGLDEWKKMFDRKYHEPADPGCRK